jgi:hypothetical protein
LSPHQKLNVERLKLRGYFCYLSDDYDDKIKEINNYMLTRRKNVISVEENLKMN